MEWESVESVRRLLAQQERRIGRFFDIAINELLNDLDIGRLERLIRENRLLDAIEAVEQIAISTANANQQAFIEAGRATATYIQSGSVATIGFDITNQQAVDLMRQNRLEFINDFSEKQTRAVRSAILEGVREGLGPRDVARQFRGAIGLTEHQEGAVRNFRRLLERIGEDDVARQFQREALTRELRDKRSDPRIRRAIREQTRLSPDEIDRMVERYRRGALRRRSQDIARTEALHSVHGGRRNALQQAIGSGAVEVDSIRRRWNTGQDGRQRIPHDELNGVIIRHGEVYTNSLGRIAHPGDRSAVAANVINCRCVETIRIR